ncbi:MAG: PAS domain-containing protein, partial [Candidatus Omnitrophota bacterium]
MKNIKKSIKFKLIIHIIILSIVMGIASLFFLSKLRNASIVSKQLEREVLLTSETLLLMQRSLADAYKYQEYFHEKFHDPKDFVKIQRSESEFLYLMVKYNMNIVRLLGNRESADSKKHFDRFTFSIWQEMKIKEFDIPELPDVVKDRKQILQNRSNQYLHSAWQYFRTYKQWLRLQYMGKAYEANVVERKLGQLLVDASLSYNEIQEEIITVHRVLGDFNTQRIHEGYLNFKKVSENLIYLGVLLFFSILFLTLCFVQSNVIKPIRILIEGMQKVKEGKYEVRISSISSDEFDDLALSFNQMLDNLAIVKADRMQLLEEIQRRKVIEGELSAKTKSLDAQNTLFQAVLKSVNEGVIVCDKEGNFIVYNEYAKERLGLDKDAGGVPEDWPKNFGLYHSDTKEFYKAEDLPMVQALNGRYIVDELIYIKNENHKEGVYITINASPLKDKQGDIIGGTSVLRDITKMIEEQKKLETINLELRMNERAMLNILKDLKEAEIQIKKTHVKLVQSEKLASIGHLAAGIAHEINNPIGFIGSNLQTLGPYIKSYRIMLDLSRQLCEAVEQKDWDKAEIINQQWNDALKENNIEFIETDIY